MRPRSCAPGGGPPRRPVAADRRGRGEVPGLRRGAHGQGAGAGHGSRRRGRLLAPHPIGLLPLPRDVREGLLRFGLLTMSAVAAMRRDLLIDQFGNEAGAPGSSAWASTYEVLLYAEDYDWCNLGAYSTNDGPPVYGTTPRIAVTAAGVTDIAIQLPGPPPELCRRMTGTILGPAGEPVEGVHVRLHRPADGVLAGNTTASQGMFSVVVPNGLYEVLLYAERHDWCYLGAYDRDGGVSVAGPPPLVDLGTENPSGIVIRLPGTPAELAHQNCA